MICNMPHSQRFYIYIYLYLQIHSMNLSEPKLLWAGQFLLFGVVKYLRIAVSVTKTLRCTFTLFSHVFRVGLKIPC